MKDNEISESESVINFYSLLKYAAMKTGVS